MSYPALMEKLDMSGPTGGADMPGAEGGGGLMGEAIGGKDGDMEGGNGELLVKGDVSVERGGNWEETEGGVARALLNAGREGTGDRAVVTAGEPVEMELVPWKDSGLDRPEIQKTNITLQTYFSLCHFLI